MSNIESSNTSTEALPWTQGRRLKGDSGRRSPLNLRWGTALAYVPQIFSEILSIMINVHILLSYCYCISGKVHSNDDMTKTVIRNFGWYDFLPPPNPEPNLRLCMDVGAY